MTNNRCLIDSSALIALNNARDQYHQEACKIAATLEEKDLVISDAVITETYALLRYRLGFHVSHYFLKTILSGAPFVIAEITPQIRRRAFQILEQYHDQKVSYCDALNVAVMKEQQINKIFAFDQDFEILGVELVR